MTIVFQAKNITKVFGGGELLSVKALDNVNLTIEKGEFTAIVGPSGSGKSTFLHIVGGLDFPSSGSIEWNGKDISHLNSGELSDFRRDHIGFVFQSFNLIPVFTAEENIEYVMVLQGLDANTRKARVNQILKDIGLEGKNDRLPSQLSGGQQQRVAVARAIVARPDLILADEPTANLDSVSGTDLIELMRKLNESQGMTFIFSTHDQKIMDRAKRLITLEDGKVVQDIRR